MSDKQLECSFDAAAEPAAQRQAQVFLFPAARNLIRVRAVAEELAALPKDRRARAWSRHAYQLLKACRDAGISRDAAVADALAFRDAVRLLVRYLDADPAKGRGGAA